MEREEEGGEEGEEGSGEGREQMEEGQRRRRAAKAVDLSWEAPSPLCPFQPHCGVESLFPGGRLLLRYSWERTHPWGPCTS